MTAQNDSDTPSRTPNDSQPARASAKRTRKLSPVLKFIILFLVGLAVFGGLYAHVTASYHDSLIPLMKATAHISGFVLSIFSDEVFYQGKHCAFHGFMVEIIDECTGLLEMVIYFAAVLSFSTTIRKKLLGLLIGLPAIYLFNVLRITLLIVVGAFWPAAFDFMHLYFWQGTLIIMIGSVWVGWLYLVVYREKKPVAVSS